MPMTLQHAHDSSLFFEWVAKSVKPLLQVSSRVYGPRTVQDPDSVVKSYYFPHRFESEDHARPWFCLTLK